MSRLDPTPPREYRERATIHAAAALLMGAILTSPALASAQDTIRIPEGPECETCRIEVERVARLGDLQDEIGPGAYARVTRGPAGEYYVSPAVTNDGVLLYHADGALDRLIGRSGQGPGEFAVPGEIVATSSGELYVFDRIDRSRSKFAPDVSFARRDRIGIQVEHALPLPDGSMIVQGSSNAPDMIGMPAHLIDADGSVVRSFGVQDPVVGPGIPELEHHRSMGPADVRSVWLARPNRYEIGRWTFQGLHELTIVREPAWFEEWTPGEGGHPLYQEPPSTIRGVWQDDDGLLWVLATVAASDWSPIAPAPEGRAAIPPPAERTHLYDTVIEVIDLDTMRVVARMRAPHLYAIAPVSSAPGAFHARSSDETGMSYVDIWEIRLTGWPAR